MAGDLAHSANAVHRVISRGQPRVCRVDWRVPSAGIACRAVVRRSVLGAMLAHVPGECKPIGRTVRVHSVLVANLRGTGHLHIPQTDETGVVRSEDRTMQVWQKVLCRDTPGKTRCSIFANVITKGAMK